MGAFGEHAAEFIARGIPVVPTRGDDGKRPAINNWQKLGLRGSRKLLESGKHDDSNLAFIAGKRSGLTVLDVDTQCQKTLNEALARFGCSPIVIRTASGKFHAYYRYNGEGRKIRPIPDVDILGGGICVAPPSARPDLAGQGYEWLQGDLGDLDSLPALQNLPMRSYKHVKADSFGTGIVQEGERTNDLFRELRTVVHECTTLDELASRAYIICERYDPPLSQDEVMKQAKGVWRLREEGRCIAPGSMTAAMPVNDTVALSDKPSAYLLLGYLRAHHGPSHEFAIVPTGLATVLSMSDKTIRTSRAVLLERGFVTRVRRGRSETMNDGTKRRSPDLYRFTGR